MKKLTLDSMEVFFVSALVLLVFISKGLFNIFFFLLVLISVYKLLKKRDYYKEKIFNWYLGLFVVGIIGNLINSGLVGIKNFIYNERNLIYVLIFIILNLSLKQFEQIKSSILLGGVISTFYSSISYFTPEIFGLKTLYLDYQRTKKMASFQGLIRWARLLQITIIINFINLEKVKKIKYRIITIISFFLYAWNLVINGQRAAILASTISVSLFMIMYIVTKKQKAVYFITTLIVTVIMIIGFGNKNDMIKHRIVSIFDIESNISNKVRIGYWKIGIDLLEESNYLGVGSGKIGDQKLGGEFVEFINKQSKEYKKKYYKNQEGAPFENNYLNLAVENGIAYLVYFLIMQFIILYKIFKKYLLEIDVGVKTKLAAIFSLIIGDRVYIFFYPHTDKYVELLIIFLIFYAFKLGDNESGKKIN